MVTQLVGLLNTQRREDTVVDGVVKEQDFCRFDEDRHGGGMSCATIKLTQPPEFSTRTSTAEANAEEGQNGGSSR